MFLPRKVALVAAAVALAFPVAAMADEVHLIFATLAPAEYTSVTKVYMPWANRINVAGKGILQIDVRNGMALASNANVYDRVDADVIQIAAGIPGLVGGKFPLTEVVGLPFVADDAENGSVTYWRLYKAGLLDIEYKDIYPLALSMYLPQGVHLAKAPASLDDLKGIRLRVVTKLSGEVISRLGGTPEVIEPADTFSAVQRGMVDGVVMSWAGLGQLNLLDVTFYHVETPLGTGATMVFMARKKYEALPPTAKKLLDEYSGESFSRAVGRNFDEESRSQRASITASGKHTIVSLSPAQDAHWRQSIEPVIDAWVASHPGGEKLLAAYRQLLADAKAGR
jgi:TRAP-type C4-dicarboxylate transport system substrate-binding protein